jgi:hypothetical protein
MSKTQDMEQNTFGSVYKINKFILNYNRALNPQTKLDPDTWTMDQFYEFITRELPLHESDVMHYMFDNSFTSNEIIYLISGCKSLNKENYNINKIQRYENDYKIYSKNLKIDKKKLSNATIENFSDSDFFLAGSTFVTELRNLVQMYQIKIFIMNRKGYSDFKQNIPTLIDKINDVIKTKTSVINIQDVVAIKTVSQSYAIKIIEFKQLDDAMINIIKGLLENMVVNCKQIEQAKGNSILLTRLVIEKEDSPLKAMFYNDQFKDVNTSNDLLAKVTIRDIVTEFQLSSKTYILGRFIKHQQEDNKIPVFSSTYPHIECMNHAQIKVNDKEVTIENLENYPHNGTSILRDDVTIDIPSYLTKSPPIHLFNNDIICIGGKIPKLDIRSPNRQGYDGTTENDAKYKLYIPKPTTIILNGFIECSVNDATSLMNSIVTGVDKSFIYNQCIHKDKYFKKPNWEGGGPAYITIAGRRRKIQIQKGKQYVNYKSELILVSKLKKISK